MQAYSLPLIVTNTIVLAPRRLQFRNTFFGLPRAHSDEHLLLRHRCSAAEAVGAVGYGTLSGS